MKADFPALWAESPSTLRREPTNAEMAGGFPCGDLDINLFNELFFRLAQIYREAANAITQNGQSPSPSVLDQLSKAIRRPLFAIDTGTPNHLALAVPNWDSREGCLFTARVGAGNTNTGATDVAIGGTAALPVTYADGTALTGGELVAGREIVLLTTPNSAVLLSVRPTSSTQVTNVIAQTTVGKGLFSDAVAGTKTWTVPAGVYWIYVICVGGGAGGSGNSTSGTTSGAGGGAGGTAAGWVSVTPNQVISYIIGSGGNGSAYQVNSTAGGSSSVASFMSATGGGATENSVATSGGLGGMGSGGQTNFVGGNGGDGNVKTPFSATGVGGISSLGGGARASTIYAAPISNGRAPGSGGGGLYQTDVTNTGGRGADGYVSFQY